MKPDIRKISFAAGIIILLLTGGLAAVRGMISPDSYNSGSYHYLPADSDTEDPLKYIGSDYKIDPGFFTAIFQ